MAITDTDMYAEDGMLPLPGNNEKFVYGGLAGRYSTDNTYFVSPGIGYQGIVRDVIFGGYLFGNYNRTSLHKNFWVINPGVELISPLWDLHINSYFATNKRQALGSKTVEQTLVSQVVQFETGTHIQCRGMQCRL